MSGQLTLIISVDSVVETTIGVKVYWLIGFLSLNSYIKINLQYDMGIWIITFKRKIIRPDSLTPANELINRHVEKFAFKQLR